jgi:hypothetical protein
MALAWAIESKRSRGWRIAGLLAFGAYAATAFLGQTELLRMRSGYPQVMAGLERQKDPAACASYGTLLTAYLVEAKLEGGSYEALKDSGALPPYFVEDASQLHYKQIPGAFVARPPDSEDVRRFAQGIGSIFLAMEGVPRFGPPLKGIRYIASLDENRCAQIVVYRLPPRLTGR